MKKHFAMGFLLFSCALHAQVTYDRILHADREPENWLTYSGGYASNRYSLSEPESTGRTSGSFS